MASGVCGLTVLWSERQIEDVGAKTATPGPRNTNQNTTALHNVSGVTGAQCYNLYPPVVLHSGTFVPVLYDTISSGYNVSSDICEVSQNNTLILYTVKWTNVYCIFVFFLLTGLVTDYRVGHLISTFCQKWNKSTHLTQSTSNYCGVLHTSYFSNNHCALLLNCPAALADSSGQKVSFTKNVVCLPHVWAQRPAGSHSQGRQQTE